MFFIICKITNIGATPVKKQTRSSGPVPTPVPGPSVVEEIIRPSSPIVEKKYIPEVRNFLEIN